MYIERIRGQFISSLPTGIVVDVQGIGYGLELPLSTLCQLPPVGSEVTLWTYTHVREDAIRLFGFTKYEDRLAFEIMLGISGVGPKVALAILSTLTVKALRQAIEFSRPEILEQVPGVGKRSAEKILLELKPKVLKLQPSPADLGLQGETGRLDGFEDDFLGDDDRSEHSQADHIFDDLKSALENLGFKEKLVSPILKKQRLSYSGQSFQEVLKEALLILREPSEKRQDKKAARPKTARPQTQKTDRELF